MYTIIKKRIEGEEDREEYKKVITQGNLLKYPVRLIQRIGLDSVN